MSKEAMKLALDALEGWGKGFPDNWGDLDTEAVTALREALASEAIEQPAQQGCMRCNTPKKCALYGCSPLTWPSEQPAQQEQNRQIDQLIQERDHRDEIIDKLCDAVLGPDRYEWSSQYFFEDAVREVEERMAEQPAQQEPVVWMYVNKSTHETKFQKHMRDFVDHSLWSEVPLYGEPLANHELQCVCGAVWLGDELVHLPDKRPPAQRTWAGLTDGERNHARQAVTYSQLAMTASEWTEAVQIETERRLREKNNA